jgi:hypothetical protein
MTTEKPVKNFDFSRARHDWLNLATATEHSLTVIRPLTETEVAQYRAAHHALSAFVHSHWPVRVLEGNILTLQEFLDATYARFKGGLREYTDDFHVDANRHIMNFLASAGSFWAFAIREHKRIFGRKSKELAELVSKLEAAKGRSFHLRLTLALRNYAAHYDLPLGGIQFSGRSNDKGEKIHTVIVNFNTSRLLEDKDIDDAMRQELTAAGEEIPVLPILGRAMEELAKIQELITNHRLPSTVPHAEFMLRLSREVTVGSPQIVKSVVTRAEPPRQFKTLIGPIFPASVEEILEAARARRDGS